jgi:protocatechuate 3,4-dioxygenase alpha subunit
MFSGDGIPVPDSVIEVWHRGPKDRFVFGRVGTDDTGTSAFETTWPSLAGPGSNDAPHVNLCIFMRGLLRHLYTRVYFPDPALAIDPVLLLVPEDRRGTLIARPAADAPRTWLFDIHLQGNQETVFFNI